jgi:hypothetical protein
MTQKATIAQVQVGNQIIEGLMLPDGSYRIAVTQVADLLAFDSNQASRNFKTLLGNGYQFDKAKSILHPKAVNTIKLPDFMRLLTELVSVGNIPAKALLLALAEESIERRFNHAFDVKCTEEEYNEKLKLRIKRLMARHDYTDVLMNRHVDLFGTKPEPCHYRDWTVMVNQHLFGVKHFKCDRDNMTPEQQELISDFERTAKRFASKNAKLTPNELVIKTLDTF